MKISIGTQHLLRQFELERQQINVKRSIRQLLDSVGDVNECQVLHLAYLWHVRLIYLVLSSCMPSQHKRPCAACSALALKSSLSDYVRCLRRWHAPALLRCEKYTIAVSDRAQQENGSLQNAKCTCTEICSAQHEKTGRLRLKTDRKCWQKSHFSFDICAVL